jgi:MFS family permease
MTELRQDSQRELDHGLRRSVRALRHRDYRWFWLGAFASNIGTCMQNLVVPFVVYELTRSSKWVGFATVIQFVPAMLLTPVGGAIADRWNRRHVLLITQGAMSLSALALWAAWSTGASSPWVVLAPVLLVGAFTGLNNPSMQSLTNDLVPRQDLFSAVTLNSMQFNAARALGPAVAGLVLTTLGVSWTFLLNSLSFTCVLGVLLVIRANPTTPAQAPVGRGMAAGFVEALRYVRTHRGIAVAIGLVVLVGALGSPIQQFTVVFGAEVFHVDIVAISVMNTAFGLGAILVAPLVSGWDTVMARSRIISIALPTYGCGIVAFALSPTYHFAAAALFFVGAGFLATIATLNTSIQLIVADHIRGRVLGLRLMAFQGSYPLGAVGFGLAAAAAGPRVAVAIAGAILASVALVLRPRPTNGALLLRLDEDQDDVQPAPT